MKTKKQEDLKTKLRNNYIETEQRVRTQEYQIGDHVRFFTMKDCEDKEWGDISEIRQNKNGVYEYLIINEDYSYGWISAYDILCKNSNTSNNQITPLEAINYFKKDGVLAMVCVSNCIKERDYKLALHVIEAALKEREDLLIENQVLKDKIGDPCEDCHFRKQLDQDLEQIMSEDTKNS